MHPLLRPFYAGSATLATAMAALAPESTHKLARTFRARRDLIARWEQLAARHRDPSRPLVWMHAPSVGEGLQARPVAHALRAQRPDIQLAYSWFSPSAEAFAPSVGADLADYLPFDTASAADRLLTALHPSVLLFAKLDLWPVLVERAAARAVPVVMVSGTVAPGSGRRSAVARALTHDAYAALSAVGAIDAANGERLIELGVRREVLQVTGDTRFDQVWERAQRVDHQSALLRALRSDRPTLVAGSTWPADEAVLLPAWTQIRTAIPDARLIIAPHEPTSAHLAPILSWAASNGLRVSTLSALEHQAKDTAAPAVDVVVVDRVGVLGDIYAIADVAFVGGGFHAAGLHSVIEPASHAVPVLFGPRNDMSREAGLLLAAEAASAPANSTELAALLQEWLRNADVRRSAGERARYVVETERGATARAVTMLAPWIGAPAATPPAR